MSVRTVRHRDIALRTAAGVLANAVTRRRDFRYHTLRDLWTIAKRSGARNIRNIETSEIVGYGDVPMTGYFDDAQRSVLVTLCQRPGVKTFFEIGTYRGRTTWTVAHNCPDIEGFTLDLPDMKAAECVRLELTDPELFEEWRRGEAFQGTPEAERIRVLQGDSATFDFSPYEGRMDVVYVDGSHSYSYVKNDTEAALRMLSPTGTIVWDDYPGYAGLYAYLEKLGGRLDAPLFHVYGTRLVVYSRCPATVAT